ncbi:MAG TPA: hypothetical protein VLV83_09595 [Acidobacteriota bacterium]|nr:hypothetical protein [Acidobacteriota bacterium]
MTASVDFLSILVIAALLLSAATPVVLLILLVRDWKSGGLW